ncbi:DEAD/DEAH box helicase family protein [Cystobacter fuscus]
MSGEIGTAKVGLGTPTLVPRIDGPVLSDTLGALAAGIGKSPPMPLATLEVVKEQVMRLMTSILRHYEANVASGEIGPSGTGSATEQAPLKEGCPTGLLYGRVQSGKTLAMITTAAMAIDNGFKVIVVLTSDNVSLVKQTADRFGVLQGVVVKESTDIGSWLSDVDHVRASLSEAGLVLITAKNSSHLSTFVDFLQTVGASDHPALILDDEADQASLDTSVAARSRARAKGKLLPPVRSLVRSSRKRTSTSVTGRRASRSVRRSATTCTSSDGDAVCPAPPEHGQPASAPIHRGA